MAEPERLCGFGGKKRGKIKKQCWNFSPQFSFCFKFQPQKPQKKGRRENEKQTTERRRRRCRAGLGSDV